MARKSTVEMQLDESANGQEVTVPVGEVLELALPETRTSGYRWTVESSGAPVAELIEDRADPPGRTPGQAGSHHWMYRVNQPGRASIELRYARPWASSSESARTFRVDLVAE